MQRLHLIVGFLLCFPVVLPAQEDGCDVTHLEQQSVHQTGDILYITGRTKFECSGNVTVISDNAMRASGRRTLNGNVIFTDPEKSIRTPSLQYDEATGQVQTFGHTVVTDLAAGSILVAPNGLTYWRERRDRPHPRIEVLSGRPTLTVMEKPEAGKTADTTKIVSDRMEIIGQKLFRGWGRVEVKRGQLDATGNQTVFDDSLGLMDLWGIARIKGESYDVHGDSIHAEVEGELFRELRVFRNARIDSKDMKVVGERLRIAFDSGVVHRLIALGPGRKTGTAESKAGAPENEVQATATTDAITLRADSIDALAPRQELQKVTAVGNAFGARMPDSLDLALPEVIQRDWLRGDTVIAHFIKAPDSVLARRAPSDSSFDRVLDRLVAVGRPGKLATALYRIRSKADSASTARLKAATTREDSATVSPDSALMKRMEVGHIAARRIEAMFRDGEIYDVDATGDVRGLYLQPVGREAGGAGPVSSSVGAGPPSNRPPTPSNGPGQTSRTAQSGRRRAP